MGFASSLFRLIFLLNWKSQNCRNIFFRRLILHYTCSWQTSEYRWIWPQPVIKECPHIWCHCCICWTQDRTTSYPLNLPCVWDKWMKTYLASCNATWIVFWFTNIQSSWHPFPVRPHMPHMLWTLSIPTQLFYVLLWCEKTNSWSIWGSQWPQNRTKV